MMGATTLTNKEKYPIGTRVKYVINHCHASKNAKKDVGKVGTIVGYDYDYPLIFLPRSEHISLYSTETMKATWRCEWFSIEILPQVGEQLLFKFMSEAT